MEKTGTKAGCRTQALWACLSCSHLPRALAQHCPARASCSQCIHTKNDLVYFTMATATVQTITGCTEA